MTHAKPHLRLLLLLPILACADRQAVLPRPTDVEATSSSLPKSPSEDSLVEQTPPDSALNEALSTWAVEARPKIQIGVANGDPRYTFGEVFDAALYPDGRIAIVDGQSLRIRVFDAAGHFATEFGGRGGGPSEFGSPMFLAVSPPDTLVVWDPRRARLTWYMPSGKLVRERTLSDVLEKAKIPRHMGGRIWMLSNKGALLWIGLKIQNRIVEGPQQLERRVTLIDPATSSIHDYGLVSAGGITIVQREDGRKVGVANPISTIQGVALRRSDAAVAISEPVMWDVTIHNRERRSVDSLRGLAARTAVNDSVKKIIRERFRSSVAKFELPSVQARELESGLALPDSLPAISDLFFDNAGVLWVGQYRVDARGVSSIYDTIDSFGKHLASVSIPDNVDQIFAVDDSTMLTRFVDEDEVHFVRVYRITKPRIDGGLDGSRVSNPTHRSK